MPFGSPRTVAGASFEKDQLNSVLTLRYNVNYDSYSWVFGSLKSIHLRSVASRCKRVPLIRSKWLVPRPSSEVTALAERCSIADSCHQCSCCDWPNAGDRIQTPANFTFLRHLLNQCICLFKAHGQLLQLQLQLRQQQAYYSRQLRIGIFQNRR